MSHCRRIAYGLRLRVLPNGRILYIARRILPWAKLCCSGFQKQSLSGASIFISRQRVEADPTAESISIKIPGLREWIGTVPFTVTSKLGGNRLTELTFNFDIDEVENVALYENDELEIYVSFYLARRRTNPLIRILF